MNQNNIKMTELPKNRNEITLNHYHRLQYAAKNKLPISVVVQKKEKAMKMVHDNFIQSREYWDADNTVFDLYKLVKKYSLEVIYETYDVEAKDLVMVFYEANIFNTDNDRDKYGIELQNFVEQTMREYYDLQNFTQQYEAWKNNTKEEIQYTKIIFNNMEKTQTWLNKSKSDMHFKTSPIEIISAELQGDIALQVLSPDQKKAIVPVDTTNGFDIFLNSLVSFQIPFISFKDTPESEVKIKVFQGNIPISIDKIKPSDSQIETPYSLYVTVWNDRVTTSKANLESYVNVHIDLKNKKIIFASKMTEANTRDGKPFLVERIHKHMPLYISNIKESNIIGEFKIFGLDFVNSLFLDFIMLNPFAREFIYMNEASTPFSVKKRINYHLREPDLFFQNLEEGKIWKKYFSFLLHQQYAAKAEELLVVDYFEPIASKDPKVQATDQQKDQNKAIILQKNMPYLEVSINQSANRRMLQLGLLVFVSLIGIFEARFKDLQQVYQNMNIKYSSKRWDLKLVDAKKINVTGNEYLTDLQSVAPHIFENNYKSKICQKKTQPVIIPPQLVDQWNEEHDNDEYQKAVVFPPEAEGTGEEIYLGCPVDKTPYVSMKENILSNRGEYPYLPCCTSKNTQEPSSRSYFTHYYLGEDMGGDKKNIVNEITSRKRLVKGQIGILPFMIQSAFSLLNILPTNNNPANNKVPNNINNKNDLLKRMGVGQSPFSAVRCLLTCLEHPAFIKLGKKKPSLEHEIEIEEFIKDLIRKSVFQSHTTSKSALKIFTTAFSQELYDNTENEIYEQIRNMEYFDTSLYYRWLEIYFKVHVFVFSVSKSQEIEFEIPRHRYFHARPYLDMPCVILFKHWGSENDNIDFPQYEIIKVDDKMVLDNKASKQFIKFAHQTQTVYQLEKSVAGSASHPRSEAKLENSNSGSKSENRTKDRKIVLRKDPFSLHYYANLFPNALSQYIDGAGKVRGITMKIGDTDEDRITIYLPPSQPVNLPMEESEYAVNVETALQIFDRQPTFYSLENDMVNGLWFPIYDIEMGIYIPLIELTLAELEKIFRKANITTDNKGNLDLEKGRGNPYYTFGEPILQTFRNVEKMRNIYLQTILWVYLIYTKNRFRQRKIDEFMAQYTVVSKFNFKKELNNINTSLPKYQNVEQAMEYLHQFFPFVQNKNGLKFCCVNQAMVSKIKYFLEITVERSKQEKPVVKYSIENNPDANNPNLNINTLFSLISSADDFPKTKNMQVFFNITEFKMWLYNRLYGKGDKIEIVDKLTLSNSTFKNPFLYMQAETKQIFIIQNVSLGEELRAINNYLVFKNENINLGYYTPAHNPSTNNSLNMNTPNVPLKKIIYIISPAGNIILLNTNEPENLEDDNLHTVKLLRYDENIYAAIQNIT